ncbi:hypothetical protein KM043_009022 [Ampulex compressa]|nr:hypothetical protein KM043_009022 [Ampulex compressa]
MEPKRDRSGIRPDELLSFQKDLLREKEFLVGLLSKIDGQIHALQVEQLHLISSMGTPVDTKPKLMQKDVDGKNLENKTHRELDLTVPARFGGFREEIDEIEEEEEMI